MSSKTRVIYVGVTNDLERRVYQHKNKLIEGFTSRYNITKLVYFEETNDVEAAIAREKQLKNWHRVKKLALINQFNPTWLDLSLNW
jgi:putative endonuclease